MSSDTHDKLLVPRPPWFATTNHSHSDVTNLIWAFQLKHPDAVVRFLRGKKMATAQGLYDEFAAGLQFPYYFGNNGNAFDECLTDLSWLPAKAYLLVIIDAADLLASEQNQLPLFLDAFERACIEWSTPIGKGETWDRPAIPFHLIFHCLKQDKCRLFPRIAAVPGL